MTVLDKTRFSQYLWFMIYEISSAPMEHNLVSNRNDTSCFESWISLKTMWGHTSTNYMNTLTDLDIMTIIEKSELLSPSGSWDMMESVIKLSSRCWAIWLILHVLKIEYHWNECEGLVWPTKTVRRRRTRWRLFWTKLEILSPSGSWDMKEA